MDHGYRGYRGNPRGGRYSRGGGRGGGSTSGHSNPNIESDDGSTLFIHPRSKFSRLGITSSSVSVKEVGFYSLYGDLDNHEELEPRQDRSLMRSLAMECNPNETVGVDLDLNDGFTEEAVKRAIFKQQLPVLMKWAAAHENDPKLLAVKDDIDIVSTCTILADLMQALYGFDFNTGGTLLFGAAKVNGKVLLGHIIRPGMRDIVLESASPDRFGNNISDLPKYWGRRFEVYMTEKKDTDDEDIPVAVPRFRTVLHTKLKDLNLLLAAGVDAEDPSSPSDYPKKYLDFVTATSRNCEPGKEKNLYGRYMLRWWSNNALGGTGTICAGVHTEGHVTGIKTFNVANIPALVEQKADLIGQRDFWEPNVCLGFIYSLLKFVKKHVDKPHDRVVYEFTCDKNDGRFTCREIPVELAIGHAYVSGDYVEEFLREG